MGRWPERPSISVIRSSRGLRASNGSSGCPETWPPLEQDRVSLNQPDPILLSCHTLEPDFTFKPNRLETIRL
jgi:hypothetical protein